MNKYLQVCRRYFLISCVLGLLAGGLFQMASGVYLYLKAEFAQVLLEQAWQQSITQQRQFKPWPWADTWPVARLLVPELEQDLIVLAGGTGRTLAFGPGHMTGSVLPGEMGVSVIGGHRDTHFAFLKKLKLNDQVLLQDVEGRLLGYRVEQIEIADIRHSTIRLDSDRSLLALVACYPFNSLQTGGDLRYVVVLRQEQHGQRSVSV